MFLPRRNGGWWASAMVWSTQKEYCLQKCLLDKTGPSPQGLLSVSPRAQPWGLPWSRDGWRPNTQETTENSGRETLLVYRNSKEGEIELEEKGCVAQQHCSIRIPGEMSRGGRRQSQERSISQREAGRGDLCVLGELAGRARHRSWSPCSHTPHPGSQQPRTTDIETLPQRSPSKPCLSCCLSKTCSEQSPTPESVQKFALIL